MIFRKEKKIKQIEVCYFCCSKAEYDEIADKSKETGIQDFQYIGVCRKHMTNHYVS